MLDFNRISVKNLDHLGIVAGLVDEIGIVDIVNNALGIDELEQIRQDGVVLRVPGVPYTYGQEGQGRDDSQEEVSQH